MLDIANVPEKFSRCVYKDLAGNSSGVIPSSTTTPSNESTMPAMDVSQR